VSLNYLHIDLETIRLVILPVYSGTYRNSLCTGSVFMYGSRSVEVAVVGGAVLLCM
jgi:hypothetical protein